MSKELAKALEVCLISPNVSDSNWEPSNVVDVLNKIAISLSRIADAQERANDSFHKIT